MLAQDDKVMTDAVSTIYDITQDSILRQEIRARDERIAEIDDGSFKNNSLQTSAYCICLKAICIPLAKKAF